MGAAVGAALRAAGHDVVWASASRSDATRRRAVGAGLRDVGSVDDVARASEVLVSVCPPHAALDVALAVGSFDGVYVDANAVSPATPGARPNLWRQTVARSSKAGLSRNL